MTGSLASENKSVATGQVLLARNLALADARQAKAYSSKPLNEPLEIGAWQRFKT